MQRVIILVLALAVGVGAYFFLNQAEPETPPVLEGDTDKPAPKKTDDKEAGLEPLKAKDVLPAPEPVPIALKAPSRALMIGTYQDSWSRLVPMVFDTMKDLSYRVWFVHDPSGKADGVAGLGRGLTELNAKPTAAYLEDEDIRLLVLDNIDPNALPTTFWETARQRIESGRMGLFVRPGFPAAPDGSSMSVHPLLSHPILKEILPVKTAAQLVGTPLPGVFAEEQTLRATSAGTRHPATRLIAVPEVSVKAWANATMGDGAFGTKFCYPVEEVKDGAQILVACEAAANLPAVIATAPDALQRVLWMGNTDMGRRAYFVREKDTLMKTLLNHMFIWLLGQAS